MEFNCALRLNSFMDYPDYKEALQMQASHFDIEEGEAVFDIKCMFLKQERHTELRVI